MSIVFERIGKTELLERGAWGDDEAGEVEDAGAAGPRTVYNAAYLELIRP